MDGLAKSCTCMIDISPVKKDPEIVHEEKKKLNWFTKKILSVITFKKLWMGA